MKTLRWAVALIVFGGLLLVGCSDKSQSPVVPAEQSASEPGSLEKGCVREFTGPMYPDWSDPNVIIDPGDIQYPDGKMIGKGMLEKILYFGTFADGGTDLASGKGVLELNWAIDLITGEGAWWGHLTLTPSAPEALGGVWEINWRGMGKLGASGWTIPLKGSGFGKGGGLDGMRWFYENLITSPDLVHWTGAVKGVIVSR